MKYEHIYDLIGNTPLIKLNKLSEKHNCNIYLKLEKYNLTGSSKDRAVKKMIFSALKDKDLVNTKWVIVEPTSGNTGIALASICASMNIRCIIVMPENVNKERLKLISAYGAEIVLTPKELKMQGSVDKANELLKDIPNSFMLSQFDNLNNSLAHYETTGKEIINDLKEVEAFFACYGTGGSISGTSRYLKEFNKNIKCISVIPDNKTHRIDGIYPNFIPANYQIEFIDDTIKVCDSESFKMVRSIAKEEGILVGISSGCAICGAIDYLKDHKFNNVVIFCPDGGERYLSNELLFLPETFSKQEIEDDINYMYKIIFTDGCLLDKIWLKYEICNKLLENVRLKLYKDAKYMYENDPAALSVKEVIESYPGFFAIFIYRIAHLVYLNGNVLLAKKMSEYAHSRTGIDIHPGATIGINFCIDHGTGVVIGQTCEIGNNVRIYQGVTLGALSLNDPSKLRNVKRHPTIKNNVIIYAGASILGGETVIGNNCIIGSNVFITSSIPDDKVVSLSYKEYDIKENKHNG